MQYDLSRFTKAQERDYLKALAEIRAGHKQSHWIWYIFPQLRELCRSDTAKYYGIADLGEAKAYLANDTLRQHLIEISGALLDLKETDITAIMGFPDDLKLRSCMTLFHMADAKSDVFLKVLDKYFDGKPDAKTLEILQRRKKN
ncbi:MAG: DUF1810 domain-containing protein [Selenomonadaceae bacterium]|nr:DUF1810 domain-containing protein [Selenomonadaceae bacterium]